VLLQDIQVSTSTCATHFAKAALPYKPGKTPWLLHSCHDAVVKAGTSSSSRGTVIAAGPCQLP
jgi:hypothetical protein